MNKNNKKRLYKYAAAALALTLSTSTLTGCIERELAPVEKIDTLDPNANNDTTKAEVNVPLVQTLDVPEETFKLNVEFTCDPGSDTEWRVTSDKFLRLKVNTIDLPEGYEVYIDNVHVDTSIESPYAAVDGIKQDTMDDRIHNSLMIGFPISNDTKYISSIAIEGCNETFIRGTYYGYMGYGSGSITEKRYTEEDYRDLGVYANKIVTVFDLLVKGPNDKDFRNISVDTKMLVYISDKDIEYGSGYTQEETKKLVKEKNED